MRLRASALLVGMALGVAGCAGGRTFETVPVQEGFRNTGAGHTEQSGDGPVRLVDVYENVGADAQTVTFVVRLREEDGRTAWTGRATVEDFRQGETVSVTYESEQPVPDGSQYVQWQVERVVR